MVTIKKKEEIVQALVEKFQKASGYYIVNFSGMTVADSIRVRRELKKQEVDYKVAKNTLIYRALKELNLENQIPESILKGPSAVVFGYDDPISPAKTIKEQFEKFQKPALKGAVIEGQYFDGSKLKELASLPNKQDMMAAIVGSLHAPISGIVGSINAVMRDVASLVEEVAKKQHAA